MDERIHLIQSPTYRRVIDILSSHNQHRDPFGSKRIPTNGNKPPVDQDGRNESLEMRRIRLAKAGSVLGKQSLITEAEQSSGNQPEYIDWRSGIHTPPTDVIE